MPSSGRRARGRILVLYNTQVAEMKNLRVDTGMMEENAIKWSAENFLDLFPPIFVFAMYGIYMETIREDPIMRTCSFPCPGIQVI
jgi:hypothetical protein